MTPMMILLFAAAIAILAFGARAFHWKTPDTPSSRAKPRNVAQPLRNVPPPRNATPAQPAARQPQAPPKAVSIKPPELILLEWEPAANAKPETKPDGLDPLRRKLRDRYIAARFNGVARSSANLGDATRGRGGHRHSAGDGYGNFLVEKADSSL